MFNKFFPKTEEFFPSSKEKRFSSKEKFPTSKEKILLQRKFSGGRVQKKEGSGALHHRSANIQQKSAISKSAFRAIFTKVNSFAPSFAISELTKKAIFTHPILKAKIEMHEKYQGGISCVLNYDRWFVFQESTYRCACYFKHEPRVDVKVTCSSQWLRK